MTNSNFFQIRPTTRRKALFVLKYMQFYDNASPPLVGPGSRDTFRWVLACR